MKVFLLAFVLVFGGIQEEPQGTGTVQGVVTRTGTSEPLSGVQVVLAAGHVSQSLTGDAAAFSNALSARMMSANTTKSATPGPFSTTTDSAGRFVFSGIAPGQYTILAKREGYVATAGSPMAAADASTSITVVAKQPTPTVVLSLTAGGVVSGKIRNPRGESVSNVVIAAYTLTYFEGRAVLTSKMTTTSDDRGEFRMSWVPPGDYYLATLRPTSRQSSDDLLARTFFPNATDPQLAKLLTVNPGEEVSGINITMQPLPDVKIFGQVINPDPKYDPNTSLPYSFYLVSRDLNVLTDGLPPTVQNRAFDRSEGRFEFHGILPGSYDLVVDDPTGAHGALAERPLISGRTRVEVGTKDVTDITVVLHPTVEMKGKVTLEGNSPGFSPSSFVLSLKDIYRVGSIAYYRAIVDISGSFVIPDVPIGSYRIEAPFDPSGAFSLTEDGYVADISQGGRPVYDSGIVVGPEAPDDIQVIVRMNGGAVSVNVIDEDQRPVKGATIALVPQASRRQNRALYRSTSFGISDDHIVLRGIAPGEYKIFAWESLPPYSAYQNAEILSKFETRGQIVSIAPGITTAVQVRVITK